jgi:hypothetical protein
MNRIEHTAHGCHDIAIGETQNAKAFSRKIGVTLCVALQARLRTMLFAIDFDNQARSQTAEVSDIGAERKLPAKVRRADDDMLAQAAPEATLGVCRLAAHPLRIGARELSRRFELRFAG